jgi:hypothetical protein
MITYNVSVKGLSELQKQFARAPQITMSRLKPAMDKSLTRLQATAKELAPVDTNRLRSSILIQPVTVTGSAISGSVGAGTTYAAAQETGSGIYGPFGRPIRPKTKQVLAWKSGGTWHFAKEVKGVRPRWYMRGSLERNRSAIDGYFATAAAEVARELGGSA